MGLATRFLKQKAVYWPPTLKTEFGQNDNVQYPVEIKCRWDDVAKQYIKPDNEEAVSRSRVMVDREVAVGGILYLGTLDSVLHVNDPLENEGAYPIMQTQTTPMPRGTGQPVRIAIL